MSVDLSDVYQEFRGALYVGRLRFQGNSASFKNTNTGKITTLKLDDLKSATWLKRSKGYCLKLWFSAGNCARYDGLNDSDFAKIQDFLKANTSVSSIEKYEQSVKGFNWGTTDFKGSVLEFLVDNKMAFDIPLTSVSACNGSAGNKNEATLQFHQNDDAPVQLCEVRFHIPEVVGKPGVDEFISKIEDHADTFQDAGDKMAVFSEISLVQPRGHYDFMLYPKYLQLHGKSFDFKKPYDDIHKLFLLKHDSSRTVYFVMAVDPPMSHGQTRYHHLVCQFQEEMELDEFQITAPKDLRKSIGLKERYGGDGVPEYEIVSELFRLLTGRKIVCPDPSFKSHAGYKYVTATHKANHGQLFMLPKGLMYLPRPPVHIRFDEIASVNFARSASATKSFDFEITTRQNQSIMFNTIEKNEYEKLYDFATKNHLSFKHGVSRSMSKNADPFDSDDDGVEHYAAAGDDDHDDDDDDEAEDDDYNPEGEVEAPPDTSESSASDDEEEAERRRKTSKKVLKTVAKPTVPRTTRGGGIKAEPAELPSDVSDEVDESSANESASGSGEDEEGSGAATSDSDGDSAEDEKVAKPKAATVKAEPKSQQKPAAKRKMPSPAKKEVKKPKVKNEAEDAMSELPQFSGSSDSD